MTLLYWFLGSMGLALIVLVGYSTYGHLKITRVSEGDPIPPYGEERGALLIVDLQRDVTEPGGRLVMNPPVTDRLIENLNTISPLLQQSHLPVILVRHEWEENWLLQILTKNSLRPGESGSEVDPRIRVPTAVTFTKNHSDAFHVDNLNRYLQKNRINHLYLAGVATEYCILRTARAALQRGYRVTVPVDLVGSSTEAGSAEGFEKMRAAGAEIVPTFRGSCCSAPAED